MCASIIAWYLRHPIGCVACYLEASLSVFDSLLVCTLLSKEFGGKKIFLVQAMFLCIKEREGEGFFF